MKSRHGNIQERGSRLKKLFAISAATALTAMALSTPASAAVRPDKSITVFHNIDMIGAVGYEVGDEMTIEVFRNGIEIGSATGPAVETPEGAGLEVNHGPAGAPQPGDCWDGTTPDILPGDEIRITDPLGTDTLTVPNVDFTTDVAVLVTEENQAQYAPAEPDDVVVEGVAFDQAGNPIAPGALQGEVRNVAAPRYRAEPNQVVGTGGGAWRAIYEYGDFLDVQNQDNITSQDVKQEKILDGEHSMTYAPLTQETYISDQGAETGPGPGCEGVAPSAAHAVTTFDDRAVNIGSGTLVASGTTTTDAESVQINLSDGTTSVSQNATVNGSAWTATFDRAQLDTLGDGTLTASGVYNVADPDNPGSTVPLNGATKQIQKDTVAPANATATPPGGVFGQPQSVTLDSPEGDAQVRYTTNGTDPSATGGNVYNSGQQIQVTGDQTIKAIVIDAAGNPSGVASFAYQIDRAAPALTASLETGSFDGPQSLTFASEDGAEIRYTTNGDVPTASNGTVYSGPIDVTRTTTFRAVAIDRAGNASPVLERKITIRGATRTTLAMSTKDLKLGKSRAIQGAVSPAHADGSVRMTVDRPGSQRLVRNLPLDAASRYSFSYRPNAAGVYRVNVSFPEDDDSRASASGMKSFRVVR